MSKISRWIILTIISALIVGIVYIICARYGAFVGTNPNTAASLAFLIISAVMSVGEIVGTICIWISKNIPDITVDKPKK